MKKFLIGLFIIIFLVVIVITYLGFMPVLSNYFSKTVDLEVKADKSLVYAFEEMYGQSNDSGKIDLDVYLTSQEITSIFAVWEERDKNFPLKNVQIKFHPDGTGEASGYLKIETAVNLAKDLGYSDSDIETGKKYIKYVSGDLPFYLKATGNMDNSTLVIAPEVFKVGKVTVPSNITNMTSTAVSDMVTRRLNQIGGVDLEKANFRSGDFHLQGSVPETIKY
ncbi:MAG: hypothetical protein QY322_00870 [bacterium]|nr:MAG: hypothetical protein QY322_00870 [bacterium]